MNSATTSATTSRRADATQPSFAARWALPVAVAALILLLAAAFALSRAVGAAAGGTRGFAAEVDLAPLRSLAVHTEGRLKSFDSFANGVMHTISGPRKIDGQRPAFTYLDMLIRPAAYADADVIYVKNKSVRAQMAEALAAARPELAPRLETFVRTGLISEQLVLDPALSPLIDRLRADLIRTEKVVGALGAAMSMKQPAQLLGRLRIVPPSVGDLDARWHGIGEVMAVPGEGGEGARLRPIEGLDPERQRAIAARWIDVVNGWSQQDAPAVNAALAGLAEEIQAVNPAIYPSRSRLAMESWYFAVDNMSWVWLVYMAGVIPLLMWAVYRWPTALRLGLAIFVVAFLLQTVAVGVRWHVSGRWPNSNMYEAVTTASWFGACAAVVLEILIRRTPMRGLLALGSACACMVALMAVHFLPVQLNPNIGNMMPVLHDLWLYIHTNVIIFSYCLIFMAAISALLYLGWRLLGGGPAFARGGAGSLILPPKRTVAATPARPRSAASSAASSVAAPAASALLPARRLGVTPALAGAGAPIGDGIADSSSGAATGPGGVRPGAAVAAMEAATDAEGRQRVSPGEVFDGVTMLLMEMSFVLLWAGIVMGAIWADHSWGRPWGWDPKEVFALNTFIVFALLIHVRLKAKDKGLWTALLAIAGAGVMLFNWIVINFVISGLHSYA